MPTCSKCARSFSTIKSLRQHQASSPKSHRNKPAKCNLCSRKFRNQQALQQHLQSPVHNKTQCIGSRCLREFSTWSGMIQHWESGACRSGITRNLVNKIATSLDPSNIFSTGGQVYTITSAEAAPRVFEVDSNGEDIVGDKVTQDTQLLQTTPAADTSTSSVDILTPATSSSYHESPINHSYPSSVIFTPQSPGTIKSCSVIFTPKTPTILPRFNHSIDPDQLANSLESLLPRIIEIPPMYHCPNWWCKARGKTFYSLGSLFQHLESGTCGGALDLRRKFVGKLKSIRW